MESRTAAGPSIPQPLLPAADAPYDAVPVIRHHRRGRGLTGPHANPDRSRSRPPGFRAPIFSRPNNLACCISKIRSSDDSLTAAASAPSSKPSRNCCNDSAPSAAEHARAIHADSRAVYTNSAPTSSLTSPSTASRSRGNRRPAVSSEATTPTFQGRNATKREQARNTLHDNPLTDAASSHSP